MWLALLIAPLALAEPEPDPTAPVPEAAVEPAPAPEAELQWAPVHQAEVEVLPAESLDQLPESSVPDAPPLEVAAPVEPATGGILPDGEPEPIPAEPQPVGALPALEMLDEPPAEETALEAPPAEGTALEAPPAEGTALEAPPTEETALEAPPTEEPDASPPEEEEVLASAADVFDATPPPTAEPDDTAVRPFVGAFGAIGTAGVGLGFAPAGWLEGGARLPWVRGRFAPFLRVGLAGSASPGLVEEPVEVDYTVHYLALPIVPGLSVRVLPATDIISPEVTVGPQIVAQRTAVDPGESTTLSEWSARVGVAAGAGLSARAGQGNIVVLAHFDWVPLGGTLSGDVSVPTFGMAAGYRFLPGAPTRSRLPGGAP